MRIGKCKIELPFIACLAGILLIDHTRFMGYLLASIFLHEGAHLLALKGWGMELKQVVFSGFRIRMDLSERRILSYKQEMLVAAAGPLLNFLIAGGMYLLGRMGIYFADAPFLILTNLGIGLLNLFPVEPLDGSKIVQSFLFMILSYDLAARIYLVIRVLGLITLLFIGISFFYLTGYNVSLMTICLFLSVRMLLGRKETVLPHLGRRKKAPG